MAILFLVRHGQTDWNVEGRYAGQSDIPINETGREQARKTSSLLSEENFKSIYSSGMSRALETAKIINKHHHLEIVKEPRFREINQGVWEGMIYADIKKKFAKELEKQKLDPLLVVPPEGESIGDFRKRVTAGISDVAANHAEGDKVLIAVHGLTIAMARVESLDLQLNTIYDQIPQTAEVVKLIF